jgi:transposase
VSMLDHKLEPEETKVRRLEVITGTGRRRRFSGDFKARVVEETLVVGAVISDVARRHGLTPQQSFTCRRQARHSTAGVESASPNFVPAVVETAPAAKVPVGRRRKRVQREDQISGLIEVEISGAAIISAGEWITASGEWVNGRVSLCVDACEPRPGATAGSIDRG